MAKPEQQTVELGKKIKSYEKTLQKKVDENEKIDEEIQNFDKEIQNSTKVLDILKSDSKNEGFFARRAMERKICEMEKKILGLTEKKYELQQKLNQTDALKLKIEKKKKALKKNQEESLVTGDPWTGYPGELEEEINKRLIEEFCKLKVHSSKQIDYINVLLVGGIGSGKSSFINTCKTALEESNTVIHAANVAPATHEGVTKKFYPYAFKLKGDSAKNYLPIRLFDCKGLSADTGKEVVDILIAGKIKPDTEIASVEEMSRGKENLRQMPKPGDKIHGCVLVVRADSDLYEKNGSLDEVKKIILSTEETCSHPYVLLTAMDRVAVPNTEISHIYRYEKVKRICRQVSEILKVPINRVLPMSNYFEEGFATKEKNTLALINLYFIITSANNYLQNNEAPLTLFD